MSRLIFFMALPLLFLSACTQTQLGAHVGKKVYSESQTQGTFKVGNPYEIKGVRYHPKEDYSHVETGIASWYGPNFHGKKTANGEIFNKYEMTAAHRTLQMPSLIEVTNLENGKTAILRINDRGPFARNRVLDVSERGAEVLGFKQQGTAKVKLRVLKEESFKLAEIAKTGRSTRGMENAYNEALLEGRYASTNENQSLWQKTRGLFGDKPSEQIVLASNGTNPDPFAPDAPSARRSSAQLSVERVAPVKRETLLSEASYGQTAQVTKASIENATATSTLNRMPPGGGSIYIQAGAFGDAGNAQRLSGMLGSIAPSNVSPVDRNGTMLHRVRLGPFDDMAQAHSALNAVAASGQTGAVIVVD